jgi:hypothetical protein
MRMKSLLRLRNWNRQPAPQARRRPGKRTRPLNDEYFSTMKAKLLLSLICVAAMTLTACENDLSGYNGYYSPGSYPYTYYSLPGYKYSYYTGPTYGYGYDNGYYPYPYGSDFVYGYGQGYRYQEYRYRNQARAPKRTDEHTLLPPDLPP